MQTWKLHVYMPLVCTCSQ